MTFGPAHVLVATRIDPIDGKILDPCSGPEKRILPSLWSTRSPPVVERRETAASQDCPELWSTFETGMISPPWMVGGLERAAILEDPISLGTFQLATRAATIFDLATGASISIPLSSSWAHVRLLVGP